MIYFIIACILHLLFRYRRFIDTYGIGIARFFLMAKICSTLLFSSHRRVSFPSLAMLVNQNVTQNYRWLKTAYESSAFTLILADLLIG